jgi:hypothetical protein
LRARSFRFTPANILMIVGAMALMGLLAAGVTSVARRLNPQIVGQGKVVAGQKSARVETAKISEAKFDYLVPADDGVWISDPAGEVYDVTTGVVKYGIQRQGKSTTIAVSQQVFPSALESRQSEKFTNFTKQYKVVTNRVAGKGTAYFMPALENGQPSTGTDTAIFANDKILMFARSNSILSYEDWVGLLASMKVR